MKKLILFITILFLSSCGIDKESPPPQSSVLNAGELDISFFGNGILTINNSAGGNDDDEIFDVTTDSAGRTIAVGRSLSAGADSDLVVYRLTTDGLLDATFSGDGVFVHDNAAGGTGNDVGYDVITGPMNEIYVTGASLNGSGNMDMAVWKITSTGVLDTSFNGSGVFTHDNAAGGNLQDQGNAIKLDSFGNVIVAGYSDQTLTNRDMAVWKIQSNGSLDTSFDGDGYLTSDALGAGADETANDIALDVLNNILVVGTFDAGGSSNDMAVWKFSSTGVLDTSFNGSGTFTHNSAAGGNNFDAANAIVLDNNGNLYITGYSRNLSSNNDMVIWKLLPAGTLDLTFDSDGIALFDVSAIFGGSSNDTGEDIILDSQGRLVIAGTGNDDFCAWRYNADGTIDTNFNTDGFFSNDSAAGGFGIDAGTSVTEDNLNRLYFGGYSRSNSNNFDTAIWRMK